MDIFISWSGTRSRAAAEALRKWLPKVVNAFNPWLSASDIEKGTRWSSGVASQLQSARAGIICLTQSNLHADWILFEAGALSKTLTDTFVCPFLIGLDPADIEPPLSQFQATRANDRDDVLKLVKNLNKALADRALGEPMIEEVFEVWWPKLEEDLADLPPATTHGPRRSERELLEEILGMVRGLSRQTRPPTSPAEWRAFLTALSPTDQQQLLEVLTPLEEKVVRMRFGLEADPQATTSRTRTANSRMYKLLRDLSEREVHELGKEDTPPSEKS